MGKRVMIILLSIIMILSLGACSRKSLGERVAEKATETVLERMTDEEVNVDISDGGITLTGKEGEEVSFGASDWPDSGAASIIPAFTKGNIVSTINSDRNCMIVIEGVEEEDHRKYVEELKTVGFINDVTEFSGSLGIGYYAGLDEHTFVNVLYAPENKAFTINVEITK